MKKKWFLVYTEPFYVDLQMILYLLIVGIAVLISRAPNEWYRYLLYIGVNILSVQMEGVACVDSKLICVYRLFGKRIVLPWDAIKYWGITTKFYKRRKSEQYLYFSTMPFSKSPWERMPKMSKDLIYLRYTEYIRTELAQIGRKAVVGNLPKIAVVHYSASMRRKITGSTLVVLLGLSTITVYFACKSISLMLLLLPPSIHMVCILYWVLKAELGIES